MNASAERYAEGLTNRVLSQIDAHLGNKSVEEIIQLCFTDRAENTGFRTFQQFYFNTDAQSRSDYFNLFRKHYSLQGVDNGYIDNLNRNKDAIFKGIRDKDLLGVYKEFFYKQKITHGATHRDKSLGSFFTKLCHTVEP
jgi:hypothetical protein